MLKSRLSENEQAIVAVIRQAGDKGITRQEVAAATSLNERTLYDYLKSLEVDGEIRMRVDREVTPKGLRRVARYTLPPTERSVTADGWSPQPLLHPIRRAFLENRPLR